MEISTEKVHMLWNEPTTIVERVLFNEKYWTFGKGGVNGMEYSRKQFREIRTLQNYRNIHHASTKIAERRMKWNRNFRKFG